MNYIESFNINFPKFIDTNINKGKKEVNKIIDSSESSIQKTLSTSIKNINTNITNSTSAPRQLLKNIDNDIQKTLQYSPIQKYNTHLENFYAYMFKKLIVPYEPSAKMSKSDFSFLAILIRFILLVITTFNSYVIDNTVGRFITYSEKAIGYRIDGRKISKKPPQASKKLPLIMRIIKTILTGLATLLDLILMAFTNKIDVFSNIVKDLLKK